MIVSGNGVRLVYPHIGRPCIRAIDRGQRPPFGEWGVQDKLYRWVPAPAGAWPADGG